MKYSIAFLGLAFGPVVAGCGLPGRHAGAANVARSATPGALDDDGDDQEIALSQVPANVQQAALAAVPGLVLREASTEVENGALVYNLEGTANGKEYEIEVSADGRVQEVEEDGDDDDDEDDDDGDDDGGGAD